QCPHQPGRARRSPVWLRYRCRRVGPRERLRPDPCQGAPPMMIVILLMLFAASAQAQDPLAAELDQVARIATAMVDGDVASGIQTPRSVAMMTEKNPRDRWADADNYDVDHDAYVATKKTLIRLSRLCTATCDVNLWLPVTGMPDRVHVVIRNVNEISQFWKWGDLHQPMPEEIDRKSVV